MSFKIPDPNNEGAEIEVFTPEEVAAQLTEKLTPVQQEAQAAREEADKYKRVASEQTNNFKKLNEMTEAEKATLSAEKIESMRRAEAAEAQIESLKNERSEETKKRIESDTKKALEKYHGDDEKLKEALEKNFKIIALEGNDTDTIFEKARLAAAMYQGSQTRANPLNSSMFGGSPHSTEKSKTEEFLKSDKAKEAERRMGGSA